MSCFIEKTSQKWVLPVYTNKVGGYVKSGGGKICIVKIVY